jgi:hypothetical protein
MRVYTNTLAKKVDYPLAGIFYDDPKDLVDETKFRASVGIFVCIQNDSVRDYFQKLGYHEKQLPA